MEGCDALSAHIEWSIFRYFFSVFFLSLFLAGGHIWVSFHSVLVRKRERVIKAIRWTRKSTAMPIIVWPLAHFPGVPHLPLLHWSFLSCSPVTLHLPLSLVRVAKYCTTLFKLFAMFFFLLPLRNTRVEITISGISVSPGG